MKRLLLTFVIVLFAVKAFAQEHPSNFTAISLNYKFHPKFFLYAEGQLRSVEDFSYPDYYEIKGGIGYNLGKHKPLIGVGRYVNYKNHSMSREEFRIWVQDVYEIKKGIVKFENRIRLEQAWFNDINKNDKYTRNRYRYRLNVSAPLNAKEVKPGTVFANVYDEVFFISPMKPTFARNRLYGGFGYQADENFGLVAGYLWQRDFEAKGNKNTHFVYLALNINIDGTKHPEKTYEFPGAD